MADFRYIRPRPTSIVCIELGTDLPKTIASIVLMQNILEYSKIVPYIVSV